jgi:hypothetical protein
MSKYELLQFSRFFKGEVQNPFEGIDPERAQLWNWESSWVSLAEAAITGKDREKSQILSSLILDFINAGLENFYGTDCRPVTLKAFLFNRFSHWDESGHFRRWYIEKYLKL